ncbi:UNVERIFIED_CONTAM: hypothetical protein HDU68_007583 [Siphonaria sp. JEL0065]|nr:hypothetical protein HDU68_007583 [Siphonaria sp. JEL0065]
MQPIVVFPHQRELGPVFLGQLVSVLVLVSGPVLALVRRGSSEHLNVRWNSLDRLHILGLVLQLGVTVGMGVVGRKEVAFELAVVEAFWGLVWVGTIVEVCKAIDTSIFHQSIALLWLVVRVVPLSQTVVSEGNTLVVFFGAALVVRGIHLRSIAFLEPGSSLPFVAALASLVITLPSIVIEGIQQYWQATFVGSLLSQHDRDHGDREPCREEQASWLATITFSWIDALLIKARNKPLEDEDIWDLAHKDKTEFVVRAFKPFQLSTKKTTSTLFYALLSCFKWRIIVVFSGCVIGAILDFSKTFFLNRIIVYLQSPSSDRDDTYGFILLVGLLLGQLITSTVNGWVFYLARRNAINLRSTLVSEIYEKALRRSAGVGKDGSNGSDGKGGGKGSDKGGDGKGDKEKKKSMFDKPDQKANIGKIVSLMSSDANRLYNFAGFIHRPLVDLPISCIISVSALLYLLGPSALAGLLVVLVSGPLTGLISKYMIKEQLAYASATDNRTQVINEALQGIRIIKYFGWEDEFVKRIGKSRENELSKAVKLWIYFIGYIVIAWGGSILVVFSSFFCYTVIAGHVLDPATAFTSVTLLHQVGVSLNVLPMIGMQLMRAKVSLDRIADFLKEEELEKYGDVNNPYNTSVSTYRNQNTAPSTSSLASISERTPLLSSNDHVSVVVDPGSQESISAAPVTLPPGYVQPTIGFYEGSFMYFGTEKKSLASSSRNAEVQPASAQISAQNSPAPQRKWGFSFSWSKKPVAPAATAATPAGPAEEQGSFELRNVTLAFPLGKLSIVTGSTGSGKTSLLLSLLGELKCIRGFGFLPDPRAHAGATVAYVAQTAFLLNATIRDNILFGQQYNEARYKAVIEACALVRDLEILEGGDLTEIGEKGINMSGGQKQRISLARAAYSQADIVLLDDCLSAVDAPTARHLLFKCILGPLMFDRTKILVTHATGLVLPHSDYGTIVVMKNGEVQGSGSLNEVLVNEDLGLSVSEDARDEVELLEAERTRMALEDAGGVGSSSSTSAPGTEFKGVSIKGTKIVDEENRSTGSVKLAVYVSYFRASGGLAFFIVFLLAFILSTGVSFLSDLWIKIWTDASKPVNGTMSFIGTSESSVLEFAESSVYWFLSARKFTLFSEQVNIIAFAPITHNSWSMSNIYSAFSEPEHKAVYYITVYAVLSLLGLLVSVLTRLWVLYGGLLGSRTLHAKLADAVFGAPMRFFEKTPVGRLLNRFTKDMSTIDNECMDSLDSFFRLIIQMASTIALILYVAPASALVIPVVAFCYSWISSLYLEASRELKRLESISNSPIYAQFSETLIGVSTVRAFGSEKKFSTQMEDKVDANNRNSFYLWTANRWLNLRCEYLSAVMTSVVGFAIIAAGLDPGWAGLTMIYVFEFTSNLTWLIRCHANMDMSMNAVERVDEYSAIEQEPPAIIPGNRPPPLWPSHGEIHVRNLSLKYQPDLPNVLHNVSFTTRASEKIGVVGRTGAGKSTLTLAFFRILNQFEGQIVIDGIDISKIGLRDLRNRLTIIPQDPVLFEGTLRFNLDPLGAYTDEVIWEAVKAVGLLESMQTGGSSLKRADSTSEMTAVSATSRLSTKSGDSSSSESKKPVVADEPVVVAPARGGLNLSLDFEVSESGSNFSQGQRQLICMARAILRQTKVFFLDEATASVDENTDRVLVLERGKIEEYDSPLNLLNKESGIFKKMCEESGEFSDLVKMATVAAAARNQK